MFTDAVFVQFYPQCNMQAPGLLQSDVTIPIIAGPITANLGWRWTFDILQIFAVTQFVLIFFFCPETTYIPDSIFEIDQIETEDFEKPGAVEHARETAQTELPRKRRSSSPSLSLVRAGIYSHDNFFKLLLAPFVTCLNIGVLNVMVILLVAWYVAVACIMVGIFSFPPYNLSAAVLVTCRLVPPSAACLRLS
jgi:hypothetical protein